MTFLSAIQSHVAGAMAEDVRKTVAFLAAFADELVSMQKQTLEALLKSNRAAKVKEWNAAKNFWHRKVHSLDTEQREVLDDWEFVLCDMSYLQPVAFLPRLQRCLDRSGSFLMQHADSIKQLGCKTLQHVLRSRQVKQESMSAFIRLLLERYMEQFTAEQNICSGNPTCARRVEKLKLEQTQMR